LFTDIEHVNVDELGESADQVSHQSSEGAFVLGEVDDDESNGGQSNSKDTFVCEICSREFRKKVTYQRHLDAHKGRTTCPMCRKVFSQYTHLKRHLRSVHNIT